MGSAEPNSLAKQLGDEEFLYSFLQDYQDEELTQDEKQRFESLLGKQKSDLMRRYAEARGNFQIAFNAFGITPDEQHQLRCLIEDDVARAGHEVVGIKRIEGLVHRTNMLRAIAFVAVVFGLFCLVYYYLAPDSRQPFHALEYLAYEAELMIDDDERLTLPSSSFAEIEAYINRYPDLDFVPAPLAPLEGEKWNLDGATVIDYEIAKIGVIQYSHVSDRSDKMFFFQYRGKLNELPRSEQGKIDKFTYQSYADSKVNIVAWQASPETVGMMIGSHGAAELAKLGKIATRQ